MITERHRRSLSTMKDLSFICKDMYKLYAIVNVTDSGIKLSTLSAFRLVCIPAYENLFCLNTTNKDWKRGICNIVGNKIICPLFEIYKTYSKFFLWKIVTFVIKVEYKINGTKYTTASKSITPYFKCPDIARIGPHSKMFLKSVNKHNKKDGSCWRTLNLYFNINKILRDFSKKKRWNFFPRKRMVMAISLSVVITGSEATIYRCFNEYLFWNSSQPLRENIC